MEETTLVLNNFVFKSGRTVEVEGFIPEDCKWFAINFGKDDKNYVLHFEARFDRFGEKNKIVLNSKVDDVWGKWQLESFFPFKEGSDTTASFQFEEDKIIVQLPHLKPLSFTTPYPVEEISYVSTRILQPKSITLK